MDNPSGLLSKIIPEPIRAVDARLPCVYHEVASGWLGDRGSACQDRGKSALRRAQCRGNLGME